MYLNYRCIHLGVVLIINIPPRMMTTPNVTPILNEPRTPLADKEQKQFYMLSQRSQ